jgi:hypothetical protein
MTTLRKRKQPEPDVVEYRAKRRKQELTAPVSPREGIARRLRPPASSEEGLARRIYVHGVPITEENQTHLLQYLNSAMHR